MKTQQAGLQGQAPKVLIQPSNGEYTISKEELAKIIDFPNEEEKKYTKCWSVDDYRKFSPGEQLVDLFLETADWLPGQTLVDWGCGTGRAGHKLFKAGLDVTLVDFAYNALDEAVKEDAENSDNLRFIKHDITKDISLPSQFGFCTDCLEHIPEDQIDKALDTILDNSKHVFFQICTTEDHFGNHPDIQVDGEKEHLHVTVHGYQWWLKKLVEKEVIIHHSNDLGNSVIFYVTGWGARAIDFTKGTVNTPDEEIIKNMAANAKLGFPQVVPHEQSDEVIMLLAGGPSLADFEDEIIKQRAQGMKVVTVNGAYNWAMERGLSPVTQVLIDAREFNQRFVRPVNKDNIYLMASQCHPNAFEGLPKDRTYIWQVSLSEALIPHIKEHYGKMYEDWYPCPGGSTATLRALCLLRMLGYHNIIVYGLDSCYMDDRGHHAYSQPENDLDKTFEVTVGGGTKYEKVFKCAPWHVFQLKDFEEMVKRVLKDCQLQIKGDGAVAYMIKANAELHDQDTS